MTLNGKIKLAQREKRDGRGQCFVVVKRVLRGCFLRGWVWNPDLKAGGCGKCAQSSQNHQ